MRALMECARSLLVIVMNLKQLEGKKWSFNNYKRDARRSKRRFTQNGWTTKKYTTEEFQRYEGNRTKLRNAEKTMLFVWQ